jgi:hypothetical protein
MNLEITIKILNPEMIADGAQDNTFTTDGVLIAFNGQNEMSEIAGGALSGAIDPEQVAQTIMRMPDEFGEEVLAEMLALKVIGVPGDTAFGKTVSECIAKTKKILAEREAAVGCDACDYRDEPDKPGCGDPSCPHDPTYGGKIVQINGNQD